MKERSTSRALPPILKKPKQQQQPAKVSPQSTFVHSLLLLSLTLLSCRSSSSLSFFIRASSPSNSQIPAPSPTAQPPPLPLPLSAARFVPRVFAFSPSSSRYVVPTARLILPRHIFRRPRPTPFDPKHRRLAPLPNGNLADLRNLHLTGLDHQIRDQDIVGAFGVFGRVTR